MRYDWKWSIPLLVSLLVMGLLTFGQGCGGWSHTVASGSVLPAVQVGNPSGKAELGAIDTAGHAIDSKAAGIQSEVEKLRGLADMPKLASPPILVIDRTAAEIRTEAAKIDAAGSAALLKDMAWIAAVQKMSELVTSIKDENGRLRDENRRLSDSFFAWIVKGLAVFAGLSGLGGLAVGWFLKDIKNGTGLVVLALGAAVLAGTFNKIFAWSGPITVGLLSVTGCMFVVLSALVVFKAKRKIGELIDTAQVWGQLPAGDTKAMRETAKMIQSADTAAHVDAVKAENNLAPLSKLSVLFSAPASSSSTP